MTRWQVPDLGRGLVLLIAIPLFWGVLYFTEYAGQAFPAPWNVLTRFGVGVVLFADGLGGLLANERAKTVCGIAALITLLVTVVYPFLRHGLHLW